MFKPCWNLPAGHCCRDAGCLSHVGSNLPGTVLQGFWLFKWCQNLPAGNCVAGVQSVEAVLESTCQALCCMGAGCLSGVGTYLHCVAGVQAV